MINRRNTSKLLYALLRAAVLLCASIVSITILSVNSGAAPTFAEPSSSWVSNAPLSEVLNPDGSVNAGSGNNGGYDASHYTMITAPNGEPRFIPESSDTSWEPVANGTNGQINSFALGNTPHIYAGGTFTQAGGLPISNFGRWNRSTGAWNAVEGAYFNNTVTALGLNYDWLYLVGDFTTANGGFAKDTAAYDRAAETFSQMGTGADGKVNTVTVQDLSVVVGGNFTHINGLALNHIAIWSQQDEAWHGMGGGVSGPVWSIAVFANLIFVGCDCTWAGSPSNPVSNFAFYETIHAIWTEGSGGTDGIIYAMTIKDFAKLYMVGAFTHVGNPRIAANHVAELNLSGRTFAPLGEGVNGEAYAVTFSDVAVYVGGAFSQAGNQGAAHIAKWDLSTSTWSGLGSGTNGDVTTLAARDGEVYVGGKFDQAGGQTSRHIAVWHEEPSSTPVYTSSVTVTSTRTATRTPTQTRTRTPTRTAILTRTATNTYIPTSTATELFTPTVVTPSSTPSETFTSTPTNPSTFTATSIATSPIHTPTQIPCTNTFADVLCGSTFHTYVECIVNHRVMNGYRCGGTGEPCDPEDRPYFRPNNGVTRGQLSKVVAIAAGFNNVGTQQRFEDVPVGSTFYQFIDNLVARGYINGYECGGTGEPCGTQNLSYFRPNALASRGQVSKIISNAAGFNDYIPADRQSFEDVRSQSTFYLWIERLYARSIIDGYACGNGPVDPCVPPLNRPYFYPSGGTRRDQLTKMIARTFFSDCAVR